MVKRAIAPKCAARTHHQRLQGRLDTLLGEDEVPVNLYVDYHCELLPRLVPQLEAWMADHTATRLSVIDTVAWVREASRGRRNEYLQDAQAIGTVQRFALDHQVAVVGVTHTNQKEGLPDTFFGVTGTTGQIGSADTVLLLERDRNGPHGKLHVTG